jgi:hypothetical protein
VPSAAQVTAHGVCLLLLSRANWDTALRSVFTVLALGWVGIYAEGVAYRSPGSPATGAPWENSPTWPHTAERLHKSYATASQ